MAELGDGRYREIMPLGRGGMGDVSLAVLLGPSGFTKLQVIKRLRREISDNPEFLEMFLHEARLAARLSHPNIVQTNEVAQDGESYFIAMEYLEGQTLYSLFRQARNKNTGLGPLHEPTSEAHSIAPPSSGPPDSALPLPIGLRIIADALEGLIYAHELTDDHGKPMKIVHRDVSPGNVFISYDGTVRLLDFGIAKAANTDLYTRTGILKGKIPYMAPEQFRSRNIDARCDLYSVGAILWEVAAGVRLWKGLSDLQVVTELTKGGATSPRNVNPMVHPKLESMCLKALALDANERYPSATALQADVEALLRELGGCPSREVGKYVSGLFAAKRAQQQQHIESKLREFRQAAGLRATGARPAPTARSSVAPGPPRPGDDGARFPQSVETLHARTTAGLTAPSMLNPSSIAPRVGSVLLAGATVFLGVGIGGVAYWASGSADAPKAESSVSSSLGAPNEPQKTHLSVQASPLDAKLFLDDKPLVVNPFAGDVPRDGLSHVIRSEAAGYAPETRLVTFAGPSAEVKIDLERRRGNKPSGSH